MPEYFGRQYRIDINNGETVFDSREMLHPLQVDFLTDTTFGAALSSLELSIYNLSKDTVKEVLQGQSITLQAGYEDGFGVIFRGTISNVQTPQEGTERRTTMWCWSGINQSQQKICQPSFGVASRNFEIIKYIAGDLMGVEPELVGFDESYIASLGISDGGYGECSPHKVLLNQFAQDKNFQWLIEDARVVLIRNGAHRKGSPRLVNSNNGLVGGVSLTLKGADLEVKLDPALRVGDRVKIESIATTINFSSVYEFARDDKLTTLGEGAYTIRALKRKGNFYESNSWVSELTCWREGEKGAIV